MSSITVADVQKILGYPIWAKIPSDYKLAVTALNRGIPFVLSSPGSKLSLAVAEVSGRLLHGESGETALSGKGNLQESVTVEKTNRFKSIFRR